MQPTEYFKWIVILCVIFFIITSFILPIFKNFILPLIKYITTSIKRSKFKLLLHIKLSRKEINDAQSLTAFVSRYNDSNNPLYFSNNNNGQGYLWIENPKFNLIALLWKPKYNIQSKKILEQSTYNKVPFKYWGNKCIFIKPTVRKDKNGKILGHHYYYKNII